MSIKFSRQWRAPITLCALLILLFSGLAWPTSRSFLDRHSQIATAQSRLSDVLDRKRLLAPIAPFSSTLANSSSGLLGATTEGEALNLFENHLRNSFQVHGGTEVAVRVRAIAEQGLSTLRADVSARMPDSETLKVIHRLETGSPTIIIDSIRLRHSASATPNASGEWLILTGSMRVYLDLSQEVRKQP